VWHVVFSNFFLFVLGSRPIWEVNISFQWKFKYIFNKLH
jgi:hypothetical protein